jgi:hypothetical protein
MKRTRGELRKMVSDEVEQLLCSDVPTFEKLLDELEAAAVAEADLAYRPVVEKIAAMDLASFGRPVNLARSALDAATKRHPGVTYTPEQLVEACANIGYDLRCGGCASLFYTGAAAYPHDPECATAGRQQGVGKVRKYLMSSLYGRLGSGKSPAPGGWEHCGRKLDELDNFCPECGEYRSPLDRPAREVLAEEWNAEEELMSVITLACEEAGYHFGMGEGCPVATSAALGWFDRRMAVELTWAAELLGSAPSDSVARSAPPDHVASDEVTVVGTLLRLSRHFSAVVREGAARGLGGHLAVTRAVDRLLEMVSDPNHGVAEAASGSLEKHWEKLGRSIEALGSRSGSGDQESLVRREFEVPADGQEILRGYASLPVVAVAGRVPADLIRSYWEGLAEKMGFDVDTVEVISGTSRFTAVVRGCLGS